VKNFSHRLRDKKDKKNLLDLPNLREKINPFKNLK